MTRGNLIIIANKDQIYMSRQFNGDMYPDGHGAEAYICLDGITKKEDFEDAVREFGEAAFGDNEYDEGYIGTMVSDLNFNNNYFKRFNSDYLYIKNISSESYTIIQNSSGDAVEIAPGEIQVYDFGKFVSIDFESMPMVKMFKRRQTKESVNDFQKATFLDGRDIDIFRVPDIDFGKRKQTKEFAGADTTDMTFDELINVCKKKTDYEYERYLEGLLEKPAFAVLEQAETYLAMRLAHTAFGTLLNRETRDRRKIYELILEANAPVYNAAIEYLLSQDKIKKSEDMVECMYYSLLTNNKETERLLTSSKEAEREFLASLVGKKDEPEESEENA